MGGYAYIVVGVRYQFIIKGQASRDGDHIPKFDNKESCPMTGGSDSIFSLLMELSSMGGGSDSKFSL